MIWRRAQDCIARVRGFREETRRRHERERGPGLCRRACLADVRKVALVLSSPRSGSSLLQCLLKTLPGVYSLSGECVPFYKLNGLASDADPSDEMDLSSASPALRRALERDLLDDISLPQDATQDPGWREAYCDAVVLRLPLQWPQIRFSRRALREAASGALAAHLLGSPVFRKEGFYLELLARLRQRYPVINPYYYDLPASLVAARFPRLKVPSGPPNDAVVIEEPPFILLEPRRKADPAALREQTLVLKSTVNAYRLGAIRSLFPEAEVRVVYLTRSPLASVNGLCDGWLHRGFFSHNLRVFSEKSRRLRRGLGIRGYSELHPWGRWWWNFDLPPGWEDAATRGLEEVCAFQWSSANRAIQSGLREEGLPSLRVRFEDLIAGAAPRQAALRAICRFLGLDKTALAGPLFKKPPVIQATKPPDPRRWLGRRKALLPLLSDPGLREVCRATGYDADKLRR